MTDELQNLTASDSPDSVQVSPDTTEDEQKPNAGLPTSATVFLITQLVLLAGVAVYGSSRYDRIQETELPPVPANEPLRIQPRYDRPDVVSDEQLQDVLHRLRPQLRGPRPKINNIDHALRFWGVEAEFADSECLSGIELREVLTDHRQYSAAWGNEARPFLLTERRDSGPMMEFRTRGGDATSSHVDHTFASLAEVGTPLDFPVHARRGDIPLGAALSRMHERFSLNQAEYEWSTLVFLHYLYEHKSWFTFEGQRVTWNRLARRLMRQRLAQGTCYGNHRLHTLAALLLVDEEHELLSEGVREEVTAHLADATRRLVETQSEEGYWTRNWPGEEWDGPQSNRANPLGDTAERLLATGHVLEWWAFAPESVLPEHDRIVKAGQWTVAKIQALTDSETQRFYPFLTHAGRALALWRGRFPADVYQPVRESKESVRDEPGPASSDEDTPEEGAVRESPTLQEDEINKQE